MTADAQADYSDRQVGESVGVLIPERIVLVVVALTASHRDAQPHRRQVADSVGGALALIFLLAGAAAFFGGHVGKPIVGRGDLLPRASHPGSGRRRVARPWNRSNGLFAFLGEDRSDVAIEFEAPGPVPPRRPCSLGSRRPIPY